MVRQHLHSSFSPPPAKPIALVGMAGRFASAPDIAAFQRAIHAGQSLLSPTPVGRFNWLLKPTVSMQPSAGGFLPDVASFDAEAFSIGKREALRMDPQLRVLLETTLEALQDAGLRPGALRGSQTSVFLANTLNDWSNRLRSHPNAERLRLVDVVPSQLAARLSRNFDFRGSSEVISTACSGGLHAVHRACQALREGECDIALAMGVNVILSSESYIGMARAGMLAKGDRSRVFRDDATGFLRGEGAGVLVLMRADDAAAGRHDVKAFIRGSSSGHSGAGGTYDASDAEIQSQSVIRALRMAGIKPHDVAYVELQAAGNLSEELAEVAVIRQGFRAVAGDDSDMPARINAGCLKPVTGHMEAASGIAQVAKVISVLGNGQAPPLQEMDERPQDLAELWPALALPPSGERLSATPGRRCALISGLGFGGNHSQLVVELPERRTQTAPKAPNGFAFFLSTRTGEGMTALQQRLARFLRETPDLSTEDVAYTLLLGRESAAERAVFIADNLDTLAGQLVSGTPLVQGRAADMKLHFGGDEEDRRWLRSHLRSGSWKKLATLWCQGFNFSWDGISDELPGRLVTLPPTPFIRETYWLEDAATTHAALSASLAEEHQAEAIPQTSTKDVYYRALLAQVLGTAGSDHWHDDTTISELGLDSLAAADLRARVAEFCSDAPPRLVEIVGAANLKALTALLPEPADHAVVATYAADEVHRYDPFPATDIQLAYLIGRETVRDGGGFGCQIYWEFSRRHFDLDRLHKALKKLIARHDMLRAVFMPDARQRILAESDDTVVPLKSVNWSHLGTDAVEDERRKLGEQFLSRKFDAARFPLFEMAVSRGPEDDRLHFALDLLIADGPSLFHLLDELARLYDDDASVEAPPVFQFRDYVLATQGENSAARAYWEGRLDNLPASPRLPFLPGKPGTARVRRLEKVLSQADWKDFQRHAAVHGLTLNAALIAAFAQSLSHWSAEPAFCVNVTLAARQPLHPDVNKIIGDFTRNVLLAIPSGDGMTFADHARQIAVQLLADCEHADFSAVNVMRLLSQKQRRPVSMPVVFTSLLGYGGVLKRPVRIDAIGSYVRGATRTPQVLLDAQALEAPDGLHISWDVMEGVLAPDLLDDMFHGFTLAVEQLAKNEASWTAPVICLGSPQALQHANSTAARLPLEPIFAGILRQAALEPGRVAVVAADRRLTFGDLVGEARCLALRLTEHGVQLGDLVAVVAPKGWRQIVAVLAISMSGAAYVPVELPMPADRIAQVLTRAGTKLALVHGAPADTAWPCPVVDTWDLETKTPFEPVPVGATDLAYVIYTSGSTGTPKGVALEHGAVSNTLHSVNEAYSIGQNDSVLGVSSLAFDLSVWDTFGMLGAGGKLVLPDPQSLRDPGYLADLCRREGVTVWNSTPSYLKLVVEAPGIALAHSFRLFMLSGDWIPLELARFLRQRHHPAKLVSLGGATEAAIWSIWHDVEEVAEHWRSVPYGKAMPNQRFHVLDESLSPTALGEVGQLHIAGSGLARGYWRDETQTGASFIRHPLTGERLYRTGDYGRVLDDGSIEFLGRRDAQVKVGGHRIELGEVEAALAELADDLKVSDGIAFTFTDASGNQRLGLCYRSANRTAEADVRRALSARLPGYMTPSAVMLLGEIPLTDNGKVNRKALGAWARQQSGAPSVSEKLGALLSDDRMLKDSQERSAFVAAHHGSRRDLDIAPAKELTIHEGVASTVRRSTRSFAASTPADDAIAELLAPLREIGTADGAHREYASAGSSYAVQVYVIRRSDNPAHHMLFYYDAVQHRLLQTGEVDQDIADLHAPANRAMAASAPLTILLIGDRRAIEPLYGNLSDDMMRIEAGAMAQLLSNSATKLGLGHCAVGWLDISPLREALRLSQEHVFIHAMVAGDATRSTKPKVVQAAQQQKAETSTTKDTVRAAWSSVLGHDNFADDASFFEVGGDSFMAVTLQAKLAEIFTPAPSVTDLFRHPTVVDLSNHLEGGGTPAEPKPAPNVGTSAPNRRSRRLDARRSLNGSSAGGRA